MLAAWVFHEPLVSLNFFFEGFDPQVFLNDPLNSYQEGYLTFSTESRLLFVSVWTSFNLGQSKILSPGYGLSLYLLTKYVDQSNFKSICRQQNFVLSRVENIVE